ncbi:dehydrogenase/reductase SDR family member 1, partial [Alligator sinensis]|uniref:Dehydrogenase/reductase SDR family member 1 n=1 Tax=Alligator sinensis TaxID=38654 RepID=A0A1U7S8J3_ALLSI
DVLVSCAFSGVEAIAAQQGRPFWESPATLWDDINNVGLRGHYLSLRHAARLMVSAGHGLLVVVSSPGGLGYMFNVPYGVGKAACDRLAADCAHELRAYGVACVALWPGMVRTEKVLKEQHGTGPMAEKIQVMMKGMSETPEASGKCVVALAADPHIMAHSGKVLLTPDLARRYGFRDVDGKPVFNYVAVRNVLTMLKPQLARFFRLIPECLTIPKWVIALYASKFRAYSALEPAPLPKKQD